MAAPHSIETASDRLGPQAPDPIDDAKVSARDAALRLRASLAPDLGQALAVHALRELRINGPVAGFWPMPGEIDTRPLLTALNAAGHVVLLPVTARRGLPLTFRRWSPGQVLIRERFGTWRPGPDAPEEVPRTLFVPFLAFDRRGFRLGYGGGFYDRTLAGLPGAVAVGCGYAALELDAVPVGEYDAPLSAIATERGVIFAES